MLFSVWYNYGASASAFTLTLAQAPNPTKTVQITKAWISGTLSAGGLLQFERSANPVFTGTRMSVQSIDAFPSAIPAEAIATVLPNITGTNVIGAMSLGSSGEFFMEINLSDVVFLPVPGATPQVFVIRSAAITGTLVVTLFWKET